MFIKVEEGKICADELSNVPDNPDLVEQFSSPIKVCLLTACSSAVGELCIGGIILGTVVLTGAWVKSDIVGEQPTVGVRFSTFSIAPDETSIDSFSCLWTCVLALTASVVCTVVDNDEDVAFRTDLNTTLDVTNKVDAIGESIISF